MTYNRVIPRDLFNEANLLKNLGQLQLLIHDNRVDGIPFKVEFDGQPFNIQQNPHDGSISVANYRVFLEGEELLLYTPLNSRDRYPLLADYRGETYYLFNGKGELMANFGHPSYKRNSL